MLNHFDTDIEITSDDLRQTRDYIHDLSGIHFTLGQITSRRHRLQQRIADLQMTAFRDYFYHLKYDTTEREGTQLMSILADSATQFFADSAVFEALRQTILPRIVADKDAARRSRTLRIWSAGCATGEEAYSLAMVVHDILRDRQDLTIEIIATDISTDALAAASLGEYSASAVDTLPEAYRQAFFVASDGDFRISEELRAMVKFSQHNLNDPDKVRLIRHIDAIVCCNVMTDWSDNARRRLVRGFHRVLLPGGYLLLSSSESLRGISRAFHPVAVGKSLVYRRTPLAIRSEVITSVEHVVGTAEAPIDQPVATTEPATTSVTGRAMNLLKGVNGASSESDWEHADWGLRR